MPLTEFKRVFFIFCVLAILWGSNGTKGAFFGQKTQKMPPLVPLEPHKMAKTQNIKNPLFKSVKGIIYIKYIDF